MSKYIIRIRTITVYEVVDNDTGEVVAGTPDHQEAVRLLLAKCTHTNTEVLRGDDGAVKAGAVKSVKCLDCGGAWWEVKDANDQVTR